MEVVILAVIVGLGLAYFATQNTALVNLRFGSYVLLNIPLYLVATGALLLGLLLAWVFYLVRSFSSTITLHGKESKIKEANKTIAELAKKIHQLEIDNARLREKTGEQEADDKSL